MVKRYSDWHHLTLRGDKDLAQSHVPLGRKLLGAIAEEMATTGNGQGKRTLRTADGTVLVAQIIGAIPTLTITAPPSGGGGAAVEVIEGFIVRPSDAMDQTGNTDLNHILLKPSGDGFTPLFYDLAHVPTAYEEGAKLYGGEKALPEGLLHYGNVDWRSADQSMHLTWIGPSARYGGYYVGSFGASTAVLCKGRILWDAEDHGVPPEEVEDAIDLSDMLVRGACFRYIGATLWLYLALRSRPSSPDDDDVIARYQVRSTALARKLRAQPNAPDLREHLFPDLEVVRGSGEELHRSVALHFADGPHPWFFNSDGTEARRIYSRSGGTYELTAHEDDAGVWAITRTLLATTTATTSETRSRSFGPTGTWTVNSHHDDYSSSGTRTHAWLVDQVFNVDVEGQWEVATDSSITGGIFPAQERVACAVDFWDGVWRYAEAYSASTSYSSVRTLAPSYLSVEIDNFYHVAGDAFIWGQDTRSIDLGMTVTESRTQVLAGLRTDFIDLVALEGFALEGSFQYNYDASGYTNFSNGPDPVGAGNTQSQSCSVDATRQQFDADLQVHFLDLRFNTIYYTRRDTQSTLVLAGSHSSSNSWSDPDYAATNPYSRPTTMATTLTSTGSEDWVTRLVIDGAVVDEYGTSTPSSSSGAGTSISMDEPHVIRNVATGAASIGGATVLPGRLLMTYGVGSNTDWHGWRGFPTPPLSGGSGPTVANTTLDPPLFTDINGTFDHSYPSQIGFGSWPLVKDRYLFSQENHPERPGGEPLWRFGTSQTGFDLTTLLAAYPGAVRFHPVGYLPKTIIVTTLQRTP